MASNRQISSAVKILKSAWYSRMLGDFDSVQNNLMKLKLKFSVASQNIQTEAIIKFIANNIHQQNSILPLQVETIFLEASLARWMPNAFEYALAYDRIYVALIPVHSSMSFWFWNEMGVVSYLKNELQKALDFYYRSLEIAKRSRDFCEQQIAWTNIANSMENLGLSTAAAIRPCRVLAKGIRGKQARNIANHNLRMVNLIELRQSFRAGSWHSSQVVADREKQNDYEAYIHNYYRSLPYHHCYTPPEKLSQVTSFRRFQAGYRQRTLLGLIHSDDDHVHKTSDLIERIYLWTWRVLCSENQRNVERLLIQFKTLFAIKSLQLGYEDQCQLSLALEWLSLVCPEIKSLMRVLPFKVSFERYPIYEFESLCIKFFAAQIARNDDLSSDLFSLLSSHPLFRSRIVNFSSLVMLDKPRGSTSDLALAQLQRNLQEVVNQQRYKDYLVDGLPVKEHMLINAAQGLLCFRGKRIISETLADAALILLSQPQISISEFFVRVFCMQVYRSEVHEPKVYNLLTRLKKFSQNRLQINVRQSRIICTHNFTKNRLILVAKNPIQQAITQSETFIALISNGIRSEPELIRPLKTHKLSIAEVKTYLEQNQLQTIRRVDIERMFNIPRATANRLIVKLLEVGMLHRFGSAKAVRYSLSNNMNKTESSRNQVYGGHYVC